MKMRKQALTVLSLCLLLFSTVAFVLTNYAKAQSPNGELTGAINDHGVDMDMNGKYDYLEVDVEINVTGAGIFNIQSYQLKNGSGSYLYISTFAEAHLGLGVQYLNLSFFGPIIAGHSFDPSIVGEIHLYAEDYSYYLGSLYEVNLSRTYNHTEFDTYIRLTGAISDREVDKDGDGFFDFLEVGVELEATKAGDYFITASGLFERMNESMNRYFYEYKSVTENFTVGTRLVYFNFSGPGIVVNRVNPTDLNYVSIVDIVHGHQTLSYKESTPLSMKYNYSLFNAPSREGQIDLTVYPNSTIGVNGVVNSTHMYPPNSGPRVNASVGFATSGDLTMGSANGTVVFPKGPYEMPTDVTEAHARLTYGNGILDASINATMFMPTDQEIPYPFNATDITATGAYSNGLLNVDLTGLTTLPSSYLTMPFMFPLDASDATILANWDGSILNGNITLHVVSGFPLADVVIFFNGTRTKLDFTGDVNITYGVYGDLQINSTILNDMIGNFTSNIPGQGPQSLYNMTWGLLECTRLDLTKNPWVDPNAGADVAYNVTIAGNFTALIARLMTPIGSPSEEQFPLLYASLESVLSSVQSGFVVLNYYHVSGMASVDGHFACDVKALWAKALELVPHAWPPSMPLESRVQLETYLRIANATAYAISNCEFTAFLSSSGHKVGLIASLLANVSQLKADVLPMIPDLAPPGMHDVYESFFNTSYCTLNSATATIDFVNGTGSFDVGVVFQGDFKAQLNHVKDFFAALGGLGAPPQMLRILNATEIDLNDFQAEFQIGEDSMYISFSGLRLYTAKDDVDFIRFKLSNWLNMSAGPGEPPIDFEKLKITVIGGSNSSHTILLYQPEDVRTPDNVSMDYRTMAWENTTFSSLKDMMFLIAFQGRIDYLSRTYYVPVFTNSTVSGFDFDAGAKKIFFNVEGASGRGFCNVTIPRNLLDAAIGEWTVRIDGEQVTVGNYSIADNAEYVFIYMNYTHSMHLIEISGTWVVSEFQPWLLVFGLVIASLVVALVAIKERRRLSRVKARWQNSLSLLASRLQRVAR